MESVFGIVFPIFGIILVGFAIGRIGLLGPASSEALNAFVYWVALPALFIHGLAKAPLDRILDGALIGAYLKWTVAGTPPWGRRVAKISGFITRCGSISKRARRIRVDSTIGPSSSAK